MLGERRWTIWGCSAHLLVTDPAALAEAASIVDARLAAVGYACDRFRLDSEPRRLPIGGTARVSADLRQLVEAALDTARRTDGLCDPTVGAAVAAAGYDRDIRLVLDDDRPVRVVVRPRRTWEAVILDGDLLTVPEGLELDLGATAKAAAADLAAREVADRTGSGVLVNLGGDIATAGPAPEGGWQVTVQDLPSEPATQVSLHPGFALATSSTLHRTWRRGATQAHHIVHPRSGRPAESVWRTASVVAATAVEANGATTAAVVAGHRAPELLSTWGLPARLVAADRSVLLVNGWPAEAEAA